jgi:hypothetical protein
MNSMIPTGTERHISRRNVRRVVSAEGCDIGEPKGTTTAPDHKGKGGAAG